MNMPYPILEFDQERSAVIEPSMVETPLDGIPERCVMPIYQTVIDSLRRDNKLEVIREISSALGPLPVYRLKHDGPPMVVVHPGVGAPWVAALLESLIAMGCRKFIACGSAGVLDRTLARGTVVIPDAAVRDEGTSYHYLPPGREIAVHPEIVADLEDVVRQSHILYRVGKTWTTDAIFRETRDRVSRRRAEGCITVEMECAAFLAVAAFRDVQFGQLLATGDDVSGEEWDARSGVDHRPFAERLFWLSVKACSAL